MSDFIPRDVSHPFEADETSLAEFEGFGTDVPRTDALIRAANQPTHPDATRANRVRLAQLLRPGFIPPTLDPDVGEPNFPTPDRVAAHVAFSRQGLHDVPLNVPGGPALTMWSLQDDANGIATWPAATIRVREGQIVHSAMNSRTGPHTIHHHGIEPTPMNDGVGHLTFEVGGGRYVYQWLAGEAGTYFYHCHRNTVLHFERGMYGALIIDPNVPGAPFSDGGPGITLVHNPTFPDQVEPVSYAAEAIWVADDIDPRWHTLGVADGLGQVDEDARSGFMTIDDPQNPHLNDFRPTVFVVTGQPAHFTDPSPLIQVPGTAITPVVRRGQKVLVRTLNASYAQTRWTFPAAIPGKVIAADGRTLGRAPFGQYSTPRDLASMGHQFDLSVARRWDVLLDTTGVPLGNHDVTIGFYHWITGALLREVRTRIIVNP
jgi:FtsP/CotA-like multicopper oxidase with cupredoxin domain